MKRVRKTSSVQSANFPLKIIGLPSTSYFAKHGGVVLTFGIFDGVHLGQQAILRHVSKRAEENHVPSAALVFRPRPVETLGFNPPRPYLTAQDTTVRLIRDLNIRCVGVLRFTRELAEMPAGQFLRRLVLRIPIRELWLGAKATVGRGPEGTLPSVRRIGEELGFMVKVFDPPETLPTASTLMDHFKAKDLGSVTRDLARRYKLPAYVAKSLTLTARLFESQSLRNKRRRASSGYA